MRGLKNQLHFGFIIAYPINGIVNHRISKYISELRQYSWNYPHLNQITNRKDLMKKQSIIGCKDAKRYNRVAIVARNPKDWQIHQLTQRRNQGGLWGAKAPVLFWGF